MERKTIQYSRKRKKHLDREQNMPSIDRLSGLPDAVLCHILSFLPTKLSVASSILARRWRSLWAHVPNLNFDAPNLDTEAWSLWAHIPNLNCNATNPDTEAKYLNIINRVMLLHKAQRLNTFRLSYTALNCSGYQLETWIATAVARHVQRIDLYFCHQVMLPRCLFTCKTLVDLRLHDCIGISFIDVICLPSLKKLQLSSVQFGYDEGDDLPRLLSGCPVLEELIIDKIMEEELISCSISSPTIKRLIINFQFARLEDVCDESFSHDYKLEINAPALRYLQVQDSLSEHFSGQMLTSLTEAEIGLNNYMEVADDYLYTTSVLNFVEGLCNVKRLKLWSRKVFCEGAFADRCYSFVKFDNLTKLELGADWLFLIKFLETADNLEVLIIHEVDKELKCWFEPFEQVPKCLTSHLRTITIDQFGCEEDEFEMVRYILKNAQVLEMMEIYSRRDGISLQAKFDALRRISLFPRGSECMLVFY
ncbi:hypothetical protein DH2020_031670 [Rehmannia glutinosa]|uniref:FBD domain-containing protein n=1 Tax=Rehmannia glutinosa TaxID=99300 RepID=A0ABR0VJT4_REHGL